MAGLLIAHGLCPEEMAVAADILAEAFAEKIAYEVRPASPEQARRVIMAGMAGELAWKALGPDGVLLGLAGFGAPGRRFFHLPLALLTREFGFLGGWGRWAYSLMEVVSQPRRSGTRRVEVLAVRADARGQGIGTALLIAVADAARSEGAERLVLEVVDTNGRAKELYERAGFRCVRTVRSGLLTAGAGYRAIHFMRMDLGRDGSRTGTGKVPARPAG